MQEELPFKEKIKTLQVMTRSGKGRAVKEMRDERDGHKIKKTRDELNNIVTEHATKDDRVDVLIRPETVTLQREEN
jgi:hypothetical protein